MTNSLVLTPVVVLLGIALRCMISLHPYSGQGKPPMFGDYEAQRHWMEITYNLPINQWYVNGTNNDLLYWGLDYPPLTAYHSWILGAVSHKFNATWVELNASRGHESYGHKVFMRNSVLVADLLTYIPAIAVYFLNDKSIGTSQLASLLVALVYPGLLLIDYGHFQYNCISLGLTSWGVIGLSKGHDLLGSVAFVLALSYKQMSLYYALPFFAYLFGSCLCSKTITAGVWKLCQLGAVVIFVFIITWLPFLYKLETFLQVLHRIFPFARGLFEDKVANVWCTLSTFIKFRTIFQLSSLVRISLAATLLAALPSSLHLLLKPSIAGFKYALVNSSLVFFLFSFQVHEKSILLVALPVCLLLPKHPLLSMWFLMISTFSMLPLLIKDGLLIAYLALMVIFYLLGSLCIGCPREKQSSASKFTKHLQYTWMLKVLFWLSVCGMAVLTCVALLVVPPRHLPDLHAVLICCYSCVHFITFLVAFHWLQFTVSDKLVGEVGRHRSAVKKQKHKLS